MDNLPLNIENRTLWNSFNGIEIDSNSQMNIIALSNYFQLLEPKESKKIVDTFNANMFDIGVEYAWNRAIKILEDRLEFFGLEFIAEMVNREVINSLDEISVSEKINLAFELGMINSTAKLSLTQANETINHYRSRDVVQNGEELEIVDAFKILKDTTKYILGNKIETSSIEFKTFRDSLKDKIYRKEDREIESLKTSPYFYIKTTIRATLSLIKFSYKDKNLAELTKVLENAKIFIIELWDLIFIEDRKLIGNIYSEAISDGQREVFTVFSEILDRVQGYDYVPETTRSNAYKRIARQYLTVHYEFNNFYNEPAYAKKLNDMGTVIPDFALQDVLRVVLISSLGNMYGISVNAREYNQNILKKITSGQWKDFFASLLVQEQEILEKLSLGGSYASRWIDIVESFVPKDFNLANILARDIYQFSITKDEKKLIASSKKALSRIIGNN